MRDGTSTVFAVTAALILGMIVGGFFGVNDGKKWARAEVMRELGKKMCPFCGQPLAPREGRGE